MSAATRLAVVAILLLSAPTTFAQSTSSDPFATFYDHLVETTIATRYAQIEAIDGAKRSARSNQIAVRAPSLATANASTAAELAQAAVSTSVAGADAGVSVSPLALMGYQDSAFQTPITIAALKDGVARVQLGVTFRLTEDPLVTVPSCTLDVAKIRKATKDAREAYVNSCKQLDALSLVAPTNATQAAKAGAFLTQLYDACGIGGEPPKTVITGVTWLRDDAKHLVDMYENSTDPALGASQTALKSLKEQTDKLSTYQEPQPDECDSQSADALGDAAIRAGWDAPSARLGVSVRGDLFQRLFGFNPDPSTTLSDGRLKDGEARLELSYAKHGLELVAGIGYGTSRPSQADALTAYASPSLSVAWAVASLSGQPLYDNDEINVVDGALPPRLVLGVDAQLQYAFDPPPAQVANVQKVAVTGFVDFRFTDKLAVRIGIPVSAELATRKADPMKGIAAKIDRQWSLPVFIATVIKL